MNFEVKTIDNFKRELKRLLRKYPSLRKEVEELGLSLADDPFQGAAMRDGFYKIRLSIKSKGKGKRGGARVVTCVKVVAETVFLVSIYDKSEQSDMADGELTRLLTEIP